MKIEKVIVKRKVKFPTKSEVLNDSNLLRILPKRWQRNKVVIMAVSSLLALTMTSCEVKKAAVMKVAPVFKHGTGIFATGGIAGNPVHLIGEDEAKKIIIEEAKSLGLNLINGKIKMDQVAVPITSMYSVPYDPDSELSKSRNSNMKFKLTKPASFSLDLRNDDGSIAIEYVSAGDYYDWSLALPEEMMSTVTVHKTLKAAQALQKDGFKKSKPCNVRAVGLFYDPCEDGAKDLIKAQVADFVKWLKGQGLI